MDMNNTINVVNRYDDMIYESRIVSLNEFLSNKYNNVHNELYNDALNKYIIYLIDKNFDEQFFNEYYKLLSKLLSYVEIFKLFVFNKNEPNIFLFSKEIFDNIYKDDFFITCYNSSFIINNILNEILFNKYLFFYNMFIITFDTINDNKSYIKDMMSNVKKLVYPTDTEEQEDRENFEEEFEEELEEELEEEYLQHLQDNYDVAAINIYNELKNNETSEIIKKYKKQLFELYKKSYKFIEIKNTEYWMPSSVKIINKYPPYKRYIISLDKYWNNIQNNDKYKLQDIKLTNNNILDSEIVEINYVRGTAKIQSRNNDIIYEVPFKYLNQDTEVSDDLMIKNSFSM